MSQAITIRIPQDSRLPDNEQWWPGRCSTAASTGWAGGRADSKGGRDGPAEALRFAVMVAASHAQVHMDAKKKASYEKRDNSATGCVQALAKDKRTEKKRGRK